MLSRPDSQLHLWKKKKKKEIKQQTGLKLSHVITIVLNRSLTLIYILYAVQLNSYSCSPPLANTALEDIEQESSVVAALDWSHHISTPLRHSSQAHVCPSSTLFNRLYFSLIRLMLPTHFSSHTAD